jgi:glycosyltransferase involved in cell wall biosynthesis
MKTDKPVLVYVIADSSRSGAPYQVLFLIQGLVDDYAVHCVCPPGWLSEAAASAGATVHLLPNENRRAAVNALVRLFATIKPDIIHCHGVRGGLYGRLAAPSKKKVIYTEHLWTEDFHLLNTVREMLQIATLRYLSHKTKHTVAVSQAVQTFLVKKKIVKEDDVSVIYCGVEPIQMPPPKTGRRLIIGTLGNLTWVKGTNILLRAVAILAPQYPDLICRIGGEGPEKAALLALSTKLGIDDRLDWVGEVVNKADFYSELTLYIQPSLSESFGITVVEAMSAGIASIASHAGGLPEIITPEKDGLLFAKGDPQALAKAISRLLENQSEKADIEQAGPQKAAQFSVEAMVERHKELYQGFL